MLGSHILMILSIALSNYFDSTFGKIYWCIIRIVLINIKFIIVKTAKGNMLLNSVILGWVGEGINLLAQSDHHGGQNLAQIHSDFSKISQIEPILDMIISQAWYNL